MLTIILKSNERNEKMENVAMVYYVYVQEKDGKHVLYGQSQDIFEANKIHQKAKEQGYEYVAIWGNLINF